MGDFEPLIVLPCFITTGISIIFAIILLVNATKTYSGKAKKSRAPFVLNIISAFIALLQLASFIAFKRSYSVNYYITNGYYYTFSHSNALCEVVFALFNIALFLTILMTLISGVYTSSGELGKTTFFSMINKNTLINNQTKFNTTKQHITEKNADLLQQYYNLKEQGVITEEEFNEKKKELL